MAALGVLVKLGVLVNPIAGMGGRVGLHGTDGPALAAALAAGARPVAAARMARALRRMSAVSGEVSVLAAPGRMGTDLLGGAWREVTPTAGGDSGPTTTAADTRAAVGAMVDAGVDLILFGGGDGTARDLIAVTGTEVPVLGVPCGVKMHSAVFATGPESAGAVAAQYLSQIRREGTGSTTSAEVVDAGSSGPRVHGIGRVPSAAGAVQRAKTAGGTAAGVDGLGRAVARDMKPGRLYLLGPGTTVAAVKTALGLPAAVAGVDVVLDGRLLATDADERRLLALLARYPDATVVRGDRWTGLPARPRQPATVTGGPRRRRRRQHRDHRRRRQDRRARPARPARRPG